MAEVLIQDNGEELVEISDVQYLKSLGYSFISPVKQTKRHSEARMSRFDNYDYRDPIQRESRIIDIAFYALELSTPLKGYDAAWRDVEKLDPEDREVSQRIIDDLTIVIKVEEMLIKAKKEIASLPYTQLQQLREATAGLTYKNTGALAAIHKMAVPNKKLGYISEASARHAEDLLRYVMLQEESASDVSNN